MLPRWRGPHRGLQLFDSVRPSQAGCFVKQFRMVVAEWSNGETPLPLSLSPLADSRGEGNNFACLKPRAAALGLASALGWNDITPSEFQFGSLARALRRTTQSRACGRRRLWRGCIQKHVFPGNGYGSFFRGESPWTS